MKLTKNSGHVFRLLCHGLLVAWLLFLPGLVAAQSNLARYDFPRVQREINLMESILSEMLAEEWGTAQPFRPNHVRGIYIPEVGVIMRISPPFTTFGFRYSIRQRSGQSGESSGVFMISPEKAQERVQDPIAARVDSTLFEFLAYYADASNQLDDREQIIIVYEPEPFLSVFMTEQGLVQVGSEGMTIRVRREDIGRLRAHRLDTRGFRKAITVAERKAQRRRDVQLQRFASVCENALRVAEGPGFRPVGRISSLYVDDFGAIFLFDAMPSSSDPWNVFARIQDQMRRNQELMQELQDLSRSDQGERRVQEILTRLEVGTDSTRYAEQKQAYDAFERRLIDVMLDYGRTLRILEKDQNLTIAVKFRGSSHVVPDRAVFQLKKADIDAFDLGKISRKQAKRRITIRRYGMAQ